MKKKNRWFAVVLCLLLIPAAGFGEETPAPKISGRASLDIGQIRHGSYAWNDVNELRDITNGWIERFLYRLKYDFEAMERLRLIIDIEGQIGFSYPQLLNPPESQAVRFLFNLEQAEGTYTLGLPGLSLQFGVGYFPYKFNRDAKNLGEALFRSGTYPLYIISNFDHCYGKLLGFRTTATLFDDLKLDLMLTSEALMFPTQDYGISLLAHYSWLKLFDMGLGVNWAHLFSIDHKFTEGGSGNGDFTYIPAPGDSVRVPYSFDGIKPAVVFAFDPKPLLPVFIQDFLGKEDLRIYGEGFVSGWQDRKNYDTAVLNNPAKHSKEFYSNRWDRTVLSFGFNVPMCKTLDVCSVEFEHFPNRYPNSYRNPIESNTAIPFETLAPQQLAWRWSVYAKKTMLDHFFVVGQVARDHLRTTFPEIKNSEKEDQLKYGRDWWWTVSFGFFM